MTLIEVLSVTVLMLILAGMLLPAVSGARRRGARVSCAGNLRQITVSGLMYAEESRWYLPPYSGETMRHGGTNWGWYFRPYYGDVSILDCPASPDGPPPDTARGVHLYDGNYGWNYDGTQGQRGRLTRLAVQPSRCYLFFDSGDPCVTVGANRWENLLEELDLDWDCGQERADRHDGQVQVTFADGHSEFRSTDVFLQAPCKSGCAPWFAVWEGGELRRGELPRFR